MKNSRQTALWMYESWLSHIIDETENECPSETIGEVVIQSEALTSGYANLPELNQKVFQKGAFFTGDLEPV